MELASDIAGPFAGKLLADFGADVVKVEPPEGDPARGHGPFPNDVVDREQSALFLHLNGNKRGIVADLTRPDDRELVAALATECDVVIESCAPGHLDEIGKDAIGRLGRARLARFVPARPSRLTYNLRPKKPDV